MRTIEAIRADVSQAMRVNNTEGLSLWVKELEGFDTPEATAVANTARGWITFLKGNYSEALDLYNRALSLHEEQGDRTGRALIFNNLGLIYLARGSYSESLEQFHNALAIHEELCNSTGVAAANSNLGNVHRHIGNLPTALEHYHKAMAISEDLQDKIGMSVVTAGIGNVHGITGAYPIALECYHRALALCKEIGHRSGEAGMDGNIGNIYWNTGNLPLALEHYHRAVAIHEELGNRAGVAGFTFNIGNVHFNMGSYPLALEFYRRALAIHEELADQSCIAAGTIKITATLFANGQFEEAEVLLDALAQMQISEPSVSIEREQARAAMQVHHGEIEAAVVTLHAALDTANQHAFAKSQAELHMSLRDLALKQNDLASYVLHNNEYTRITEEINGKESALKMAMQEKQREIDAREKEHQKHLAVLHSTLPKHIADRVARGEVVTDHHDNAAVLFLDVVGFTNNASALPAGEVVELLQNMFTTFDSICTTHNITKIKTIGDSYMAVAFPETDGSHTTNIARAAQGMMSARFTWSHNATQVQFRIGLHCGPVVAGVLGTQRMQYDVWGDTVNVASRMESSGEPGRIHVSGTIAELLSEFKIVSRGEIEIKGKGMMTTFWLENANA